MSTIRVRIAPSPTGNLHVGTARTALFNYLFAKNKNGKFILRIEDTDLERSDPKYEKNIMEGLKWLGIEADEGPEIGGSFGPYRQTERIETYKEYCEKLLAEGKAFYCFHSEEELEKERKELMNAKRPPLHLCEFRSLRPEESQILKDSKENYIIRFKNPAGKSIEFKDLIRGDLSFESSLIGDFSIAKRADVPLYNFAVVVDDFEMKISHVIRGEDHISNTPKQLLLIDALGFPTPQYAHLPLLLGTDRSKLSKRHGAVSIDEYRNQGYLSEALFNFMSLLGWNPGLKSAEKEQEIFSKKELEGLFSLERVQKQGAIFDMTKLDWMNGEYIRKKSIEELTELCLPFLEKAGLVEIQNSKVKIQNYNSKFKSDNEYLENIVAIEQPRLKKLSEIGERADYFFREPIYDKELLRWKSSSDDEIAESLNFSEKIIELQIKDPAAGKQESKDAIEQVFLEEIGERDKGKILWPLRVALSGKKASPGPFEILEVLGLEKALRRVQEAKNKL